MSKRVCNKRGRVGARFGRIRIGWRRARAITQFERQRDQLENLDPSKFTDEIKAKVKGIGRALGKLIPKRQKRTQARGR